ncbi:hypothetical protein WG219_20870 [Ectopseudomonas mendocina]|uniref:Uncharacterized protein n=1 Tax=Ectopseudomonas mendocina TaxID=300 RepID=A0ABZ2RGL4_ECTME
MTKVKKFILIFALFAVFYYAIGTTYSAPTQKTVTLQTEDAELSLEQPSRGEFSEVFHTNKMKKQKLFTSGNSLYSIDTETALSPQNKYAQLNKITLGSTSQSTDEEEYERADCAFIEMSTGCIVRIETGSFCGGEWSEKDDLWKFSGYESNIDILNESSLSISEKSNLLLEWDGEDNLSRCGLFKNKHGN